MVSNTKKNKTNKPNKTKKNTKTCTTIALIEKTATPTTFNSFELEIVKEKQ